MHYLTPVSKALFVLSAIGILVGTAVFVIRALRQDKSYEEFMPWSIRGLIYLLGYTICPPAGLITGIYFLRSASRERRRFGFASLYIASFYILAYVAELSGAHLR